MKKRNKKLLAMLTTAAIAVGTLAGCGEAASTEKTGETAKQEAGQEGAAPDEIVTVQWYGMDTMPQWFNDYLAENIGVMIEGIPADPEKTQAMIAAGNLPDIGFYHDPQRDITDVIKSGGVIDIAPYLDKLPNVTANAPEMIEFMKESHSAGTGGLYGLRTCVGPYSLDTISTGCYAANVRWDVYKAAGCPEVTDTQSYLECLKKMMEAVPETEDGIKTYGISMFGEWDGTECTSVNKFLTIEGVLECGINIGYNVYDIVNEELVPMLEKDSPYVDALKTLFTANQMGILDPDSMTMKFADSQTKLENGSTMSAQWGQYPPGWEKEYDANGTPKGYMPLVWEGQHPVLVGNQLFGRDPFSISSATDKLDACLKLINFLYDYDASLTLINGPQGYLWDVVDGKMVATDVYKENYGTGEDLIMENGEKYENPYANQPAISLATVHPEYNQTLSMSGWDEVIDLSLAGNELQEDWAEFYGAKTQIEWLKEHDSLVYRPEAYTLLEPVPQELTLIQDSVKEVVKEKSWKMIYAKDEAEFDAIFNEMVEECNGLGLQDLVTWGKDNWAQAEARVAKYYGE